MRTSGLQGTQFTVLSAVSGFGEVTVSRLGEFLVMDQTTVTRSVNVLKKAGHVRVTAGKDRRERLIRLTDEGKETLQEAYPLWLEAQTRVWKHLGEEKARQLLELSRQLVALQEQA